MKVLHFDEVQFIFFSVTSGFGVTSKKTLPGNPEHMYSYIFSSRSSTVLALTFRHIVHCEFTFLYGVRMESSFILPRVNILATFKSVIL